MSITLQEIANKAHCSKTTVSLVLNGRKSHNISEELCSKINFIAQSNNYKKKTNSTGIVALVLPGSMKLDLSPYYSGALKGVSSSLNKRGYVSTSIYHDASEKDDWYLENPALKESIGIILCEPPSLCFLEFIEAKNIPVVTLNFKLSGYPSIGSDIFQCTMDAMAYLKNKGASNIGFIGSSEHPAYIQRYQFFLSGAFYNELKFDKKNLIEASVDTHECYKIVKDFLDKSKQNLPDVFVCSSEGVAGSAMKAIQDSRISIPQDIGLLSFGYGNYSFPFVPSLSLIKVMNENEGRLLGKVIADRIEYKDDLLDWNCKTPGQFVIGESC